MSLNESIVKDAALEWLGVLGYVVVHGAHLAPGAPAAERNSFSEVVLFGRLRDGLQTLEIIKSLAVALTEFRAVEKAPVKIED